MNGLLKQNKSFIVNGLEVTPELIKVFADFEKDKQKRITSFIKTKTLRRKNSIDPWVAKKVLLDYLNRQENHMTVKKIAQENDVSRQAVYNVIKKFNDER